VAVAGKNGSELLDILSLHHYCIRCLVQEHAMFFQVDPANGVAIFDQVVRQVKFAVARGAIRPGNMVPSVRELAKELAINPNTVARAYQQLQSDGVLEGVRGLGLEVAADAVKLCRGERLKIVQARLRSALVEAMQSGLEPDELRGLVDKELSQLRKAEGRSQKAEV
jgi:GntR family transcriptional regulator